jgi:hypothetical protein
MFKREYFLNSLKLGLHLHKRWILEAFSITRPSDPHDYPLGLIILPDGRYAATDPNTELGYHVIEDAMPDEPLFKPLEKIILQPGDIPNVRETVVTCYGNALVNQMVLVYAFGNKVDYIAKQVKIGAVEKEIQDRWNDVVSEDDDKLPPNRQPLRTMEYHRFNEAVGQLPGLTQLCVPSATRKTMTADPAMIKRRDELLAQHKDRLHDPVVIAEILDELTKMDRAWMKGDPGERFYIKDKSYDVIRLKVFIMQGISTGFGEAGDLITTSLDEAWDITKLPAMVNQLRAGSYSRGAQTALAGEETKFNNRIFQNSAVVEKDCGTKRGLKILMSAHKAPYFQGNYLIVKGEAIALTEENLNEFHGKYVEVRSPMYCLTSGANFCETCMGDRIATTPDALGAYASDIGNIFLSLFMAAMHGKSLKTEELDYENWLT